MIDRRALLAGTVALSASPALAGIVAKAFDPAFPK